MANYIPEAIIVKILQRVPVKTLLQCTCICKSWYSLITSSQFISTYLNFSKTNKPLLILRRFITNAEIYELYSDGNSFNCVSTLEFPFRSINSYFTIIGSCNGLLCLSDDRVYYTHKLFLWNPSIKRSVVLPKPNVIYNSHGTFVQCLGFGFDSVSQDYKVVRITYVDYYVQVELYKLSTSVWHDISYLNLECVIYKRCRQAYIRGASHWIARFGDFYDAIVLFDMRCEVFREIGLPPILANIDSMTRESKELVVVCKDYLGLIISILSQNETNFCIWVMREYERVDSWSKYFAIDVQFFGGQIVRPLWITRNSEVVIVCQDGGLVAYYPEEERVEYILGPCGLKSEDYCRSLHVDSYVESLVLLDKGSSSQIRSLE